MCLLSLLNLLQHAVARVLVQRAAFSMKQMAEVWETCETEAALWDGDSQKDAVYRAFWQDHQGKEAAFFRACFAQVRSDGRRLREEASTLQKRLLWSRLAETQQITPERERHLTQSPESWSLQPEEPPKELRMALQKGAQEADTLAFTLEEMESYLAWYINALYAPSWWGWWKKRSEQRLF